MTHDELLAKIKEDDDSVNGGCYSALRAVVELHKPIDDSPYCEACCLSGFEYPCPTIQAIEKELQWNNQ